MATPIYRGPYELRIRRTKPKSITHDWGNPLSDPLVAANIAYNLTKEEDVEVMYVIALDASDRVMFIQELYRGTNGQVVNRPAELFRGAIIDNARKILIFHNHPSGTNVPSPEDIDTLTRTVESGRILGIEVQDFMIVTSEPHYFWSAQIATSGKLMDFDLSKLNPKSGEVDVRNLSK